MGVKLTAEQSAKVKEMRKSGDIQGAIDYVKNIQANATTSTPTTTTQTVQTTSTPKTTTTSSHSSAPTTQTTNQNLGNWSYGTDTEERQQEIRNNLDSAYAKNPTQFSSWETFANAFNYNNSVRSDKERETMKNWYESKFGTTTQTQTLNGPRTQVDAVRDKNGNLHISYSDGSTEIVPGGTGTQQGQVGGQTGLSADGKTYTFLPGYEPIYPEGEIAGDKSTSVANQGKLQQKSTTLTYQEDTPERYQQITNNLEDIYLKNPEYFTDRTTFDANFQIDQRSIGQQQLMVQWFYQKKKEEKDYNAISGLNDGQSIYDAVNGGGLTQDQLDLLKGTPQYGEYLSILKDKKDLAVINNDPSSFFVNNLPKTLEEFEESIKLILGNMREYQPREYMKQLYDTNEYYRVRDNVEESTRVAKLKQAEYDSIDANVRNRLEGTGATKAYINAVIAREQNDLIPGLNIAYAQLQADQTNWNLRHQSVVDLYGSYVDEANYEIQKYNAHINAFQTMWGVYKDVAQYDWNYKQQVRLAELQESYNNPMLDSADEDEARRALKSALQSYYDTYGPIIQRDINKVMEDVYAYAKKNGVSLSTALQKNFVDQLRNKKEYKELQKQYVMGREYLYQKAGTASSSSSKSSGTSAGAGETAGGESYGSNWRQQTASAVVSAVNQEDVALVVNGVSDEDGNVIIPGLFDTYVDGYEMGDSANLANIYLNTLGLGINNFSGNVDEDKLLINSSTPTVGSIVVMDRGNLCIVRAIDPNTGELTVTDSDWTKNGKVLTHNINANSERILGYVNPAKAMTYNDYSGAIPNSEFVGKSGIAHRLNEYGYIDELGSRYKYYNEHGQIASTEGGSKSLLADYGITEEQFSAQASNYAKYGPEAKAYLSNVQSLASMVDKLMLGLENTKDIGAFDLMWGEGREWLEDFKYLVSQLTLQYYVSLKEQGATFGQMSNAEWDIIKEGANQLGGFLDSFKDYMLFGKNKGTIYTLLSNLKHSYANIINGNPVYINETRNKGIQTTQGGTQSYTNSQGGTSTFDDDR